MREALGEFHARAMHSLLIDGAMCSQRPKADLRGPGHSWWSAPFLSRLGQYFFLSLGLIALGYYWLVNIDARVFQTYQSWRLDRVLNHQPASPGAFLAERLVRVRVELTDGRIASPDQSKPECRSSNVARPPSAAQRPLLGEGLLMGRIEVPRIGLSAIVLEGDSEAILRKAVGHVPSTFFPGEPGNVVIAGHRDTFFRALKSIQKDDHIALVTPEGTFGYRVGSIDLVNPTDVQVLRSSGHATLTLITCYPFEYIGSAPKRFVVQAQETDSGPVTDEKVRLPRGRPFKRSHPGTPSSSRPQPLIALVDRPKLAEDSPGAQTVSTRFADGVSAATPVQTGGEITDAQEVKTPQDSPSRSHRTFGKVRSWLGSIPKRLAMRKDPPVLHHTP